MERVKFMSNWEEYVRTVEPYVPGEQPNQPDMIKLNTNENPYPPAPGVVEALKNFDADKLRLYPEPTCKVLVDAIADYYGIRSSQVFTGVGSDDVLAMIFMTFFNSKKPILFPDITYSFYDVWAELFRIPYERPALDENFHIRKEDYFRENGGIVFPNPNAPTGVEMPLEEVEDIIRHNPDVIVIVDEAYVDFGGKSALPLLKKYENLLVVQTFSKSRAMAGMRIGFCIGKNGNGIYIRAHKKSLNKAKQKLRAITKRNRGRNVRTIMAEITQYMKGWLGYYYIADMKRTLKSWDEWLRRRIRMYIWKQWKKARTRVKNLRKLGISKDQAYQWGNTRLGYWRVAGSPVLKCSITNEKLAQAGYMNILQMYEQIRRKHLND